MHRYEVYRNGQLLSCPGKMNNYFCSMGKELADKIPTVSNPLLSGSFVIDKSNAKLQFKAIQVQEVRDSLAKVKTRKGLGVENISSFLLKLALPFVENSLSLSSTFPESWKIARVTPIFKDGDQADKSNYRSISVLPVITKLFE